MNIKMIIGFLVAIIASVVLSSCSVASDIASRDYFEFNPDTGAIIKYYPTGADGDSKLISNLIIPDEIQGTKVRSISRNAFNYEEELKSIILSEYITVIEDYAFYGCKNLTKVIMMDQVVEIGDLAFYGSNSLKSVTFGSSVESIGKDAFKGATALRSIVLPDRLKEIGEGAFWGLRNVERIELGSGLDSIGKYAFYAVGSFDGIELVIPESVKFIGESAFSSVMLTHVYFLAEDVTLLVGDSDLMYESLVNKLMSEDNKVGYYYMVSGSEWVKVPLDAVKTPIDVSRSLVRIIGIGCILIALYLISGRQHVLASHWEIVPIALFFMIIVLGLKINPLGELVADISLPYPFYFGIFVGIVALILRSRNDYICYNLSYNDAINHVNNLLKNNEVEFQSEEESPGGKYSFVFNDLKYIDLTKGFGEVRIDMKEVKGLALPKKIIAEIRKQSSSQGRVKLSSSAIKYFVVGLLILIYI